MLSAVRFTDLVSDSGPIPAMNRWAIFNRPLSADSEDVTPRLKAHVVIHLAASTRPTFVG